MAVTERIEGVGFDLRCVEESDAPAILALRNDPELSRYLPPLDVTVEQQAGWIRNQRTRDNEYYFAVINRASGALVGLTGLYAWESETRRIEWGRFVVAPGSFAAPETSLLTHRFAFEGMDASEVFGFSVEENLPVQSFHRSCGLEDRGLVDVTYEIRGVTYGSRCWALTRDQWPAFRDRLESGVARAARFAART